jgi:hypothetical protein
MNLDVGHEEARGAGGIRARRGRALARLVHQPCFRRVRDAYGDPWVFVGDEKCLRFNPPERMQGVWIKRVEDAEFLPHVTASPGGGLQPPEGSVTLTFTKSEALLKGGAEAYAVEFVGRKATYPGNYGHLG